jgi:gas vesicle protein
VRNASSIGLGLLGGLAVGAAAGLLLAPKAGQETRAMLKEKAEDVRGRATEAVNQWRTPRMKGARSRMGMEPAEAE